MEALIAFRRSKVTADRGSARRSGYALGWAGYGRESQSLTPLLGSWMSLPHRVARGKQQRSLLGRVQLSKGRRMHGGIGKAGWWLAVILWASWCTPVEAMQNGPAGPGVIPVIPAVVVTAGALAAVRGLADALGGGREVARQSGQVDDLERAEKNAGVVDPGMLPGSAMVEAAEKRRMKGLDVAVKEAKQLKVVTFNLHNRMGCHDGSGWLMLNSLIRESWLGCDVVLLQEVGHLFPERWQAWLASSPWVGQACPVSWASWQQSECSTKVKAAILVSRALSPSIVAWKLGREGRMAAVQLQMGERTWWIASAYAPDKKKKRVASSLWADLSALGSQRLIVGGDWNESWNAVDGCLRRWAKKVGVVCVRRWLDPQDALATWQRSAVRKNVGQAGPLSDQSDLDTIVISKAEASLVVNVKVLQSADERWSDHWAVMALFALDVPSQHFWQSKLLLPKPEDSDGWASLVSVLEAAVEPSSPR